MKNKEKFIEKAKNKFYNKYEYCDINYIDSKTKIKIKCNEHNDYFLQVPAEHLRGRNGCKFCQEKNITVKDIKEKIPNALSSIIKLNGYRFDWKEDKTKLFVLKEDVGVIAQEVAEVFPELARTNEDGFMSVRYQGLTAVLIEAIKEQQGQIEELKRQIEYLVENK